MQAVEQKKRRRLLTGAGGALVAALLVGMAGTALGLLRADEKADLAGREADR